MGEPRDDVEELLRRAGLEVAAPSGPDTPPPVLPPVLPVPAAWLAVTDGEVTPSAEIPAGRHAAIDAAWRALVPWRAGDRADTSAPGPSADAAASGSPSGPAEFLVQATRLRSVDPCTCARPRHLDPDPDPDPWIRVRVRAGSGVALAGVLGDFVTLSPDGRTLVGAVTRDGVTRLTLVDDVPARRRAAAEAEAAPQSAQEQAGVWEALLATPAGRLPLDDWAGSLAYQQDTPDSLLVRLLGKERHLFHSRLAPAVLAAALTHPSRRIRQDVFEQQPLTREQRSEMILAETDERTRSVFALLAATRRDELTEEACERLAADPSARVRLEAVRLTGLPVPLALRLAEDPEPTVRSFAVLTAWAHLDDATRRAVLEDPRPEVRRPALLVHHREHPLPRAVFEAEKLGRDALRSCVPADDLTDHLIRHGDAGQRAALAGNPRTPTGQALRLTRDPDPRVRWTLSLRPDLTEEQRAAVEFDSDPAVGHMRPLWVFDLHDDPEAMRRLAHSTHPLIRRSVARARRLPPDVVEHLARDEDRVVQLFLAESCDDAPADMLLRVAAWWSGSLTFPDRPRSHPNFPREGLLRFADDPNHLLRRLALDDPESTPASVEAFALDPESSVRYRAAQDPRLSTATAVLLLDDPDGSVRHAAAGHPSLPARVLARLLRDPRTASRAVGHPGVPPAVRRRMAGLVEFALGDG
ncbi:PE-PGRS family protein [Streptomyces sp. NPDC002734]|uniref:PE-PGRS family protein n=1 Tax=Streptomyces sp. NPDC002734 TaxID=3154426 RepID=UPI0033312BA7